MAGRDRKAVIEVFLNFGFKNKTVRELRKNRGFTAKELAVKLKIDNIEILKIDDMKIKDIPEPLRTQIIPVLRGDDVDKIPWL